MDNRPGVADDVRSAVSEGKIPWEEFVWLGSSHFVLPALYSAFERNGILPLLPADLTEHLQHIYSLNLLRNRKILEQCWELDSLLTSSGIAPLFLKGAGLLLSGLYPTMGDRIMEDIDILLPEKDIPIALNILLQAGYIVHPPDPGKKDYNCHHHLPPMYHPRQVATLEIHRLPFHEKYKPALSSVEVLGEGVPVTQPLWKISGSVDPVSESSPEGRFPAHEPLIPSVKHCQLLIFFHEHRVNQGYPFSTATLKGLYDFYLLAKLRPSGPADVPRGRFRKRYGQFCYTASKVFGNQELFTGEETPALRRNWKRQVFVLDHPEWGAFWHDYIFAAAIFAQLLVRAIRSGASGRLVVMKVKKIAGRSFGKATTCSSDTL